MRNPHIIFFVGKNFVYTYCQHHHYSYRLKIGSLQPQGSVYTQRQKIKGASQKNGDVDDMCKRASEAHLSTQVCSHIMKFSLIFLL